MKTILYVSELADEASPSVVGAITKTARVNNGQRGICGLLLFDGVRFAQLLEGPTAAVDRLLEMLERDRRHVNMRVLAAREHAGAGRFAQWELGYLFIDDDERGGIACLLHQPDAAAAEAAFSDLASKSDRDGIMAMATPL